MQTNGKNQNNQANKLNSNKKFSGRNQSLEQLHFYSRFERIHLHTNHLHFDENSPNLEGEFTQDPEPKNRGITEASNQDFDFTGERFLWVANFALEI